MPHLNPEQILHILQMLIIDGESVMNVSRKTGIARTTIQARCYLTGIPLSAGRIGGMKPLRLHPKPVRPGTEPTYRRLDVEARITIEAGLRSNPPTPIRQLARTLGVSASTVSREITRHAMTTRGKQLYSAARAHAIACLTQSNKRHRSSRLDDRCRRAMVIEGLNAKLSPQQISGRITMEHPTRKELQVSHETIYQALYVQGAGTLRHELKVDKALRSGRTTRKPASKLPPRSNRPWLAGARYSDRPAQADDRSVPGHWEGDLVVDDHGGGLVTLIERASRFCLIRKLPGTRDSQTVTGIVTEAMKSLPEAVFSSLTWDQGQEMAQHARITVTTDCQVYFCDPHSPWQRPSNENMNGLIRDYYPKGTRFDRVSEREITAMQDQLNSRPRAVLEFSTPAEALTGTMVPQVSFNPAGVALEH